MADPIALTVQTIVDPFGTIGAGTSAPVSQADFVFTASQGADGNTFVCTGREIAIVTNSGAVDRVVTVVSVDDETNRSENISYTIQAATYAVFGVGLTNSKGWKSATGTIRINAAHAEVLVAVLRLPAGYP